MASSLPSITIVTPCLNAAATIRHTIESVAAQDYAGEIEHIVIDGGSTDGTIEIVQSAGLRYVSEPDRGLSHAVNKGLALARNQLFAELNADDLYLPHALHKVGCEFARHPEAEWVTGGCRIIDASGREIRRPVTAYKSFLIRRWTYSLHLAHNFVAAPATFVRTDVLRDVGGFDERFSYAMDYDLWLKLGSRSAPVIVDSPLAAFRMAGATLSLSNIDRQFAEHAYIAREHGGGRPLAVAANRITSRGIVWLYKLAQAADPSRRRSAQ
jgi:glycosyltransferase involved in cell wall biosynthesis